MRWVVLAGAVVAAGCLALPALARDYAGGSGPDVIRAGPGEDGILGKGGNDRLFGLAGNDVLVGGAGSDLLAGGPGADQLFARDGERDTIRCGVGRDHVIADRRDRVSSDCEVVSRPEQPVSSPPAPPSPPTLGDRQKPVPRGRATLLEDGWRVTVTEVKPDATAEVLAASQYNDPPASGSQFVLVTLSATYRGSASDTLAAGLRFRLLGPSAVAYSTARNPCGIVPDEITAAEVFAGGTISGNVCWQVRTADVRSLVMYDDKPLDKAQRVWFRLTP